MVKPGLFKGGNFHFDFMDLRGDHGIGNGPDGQRAISTHGGHFFVFEVNDVLRVAHDGCGVRTNVKGVVFANAHHQGA